VILSHYCVLVLSRVCFGFEIEVRSQQKPAQRAGRMRISKILPVKARHAFWTAQVTTLNAVKVTWVAGLSLCHNSTEAKSKAGTLHC